MERAGVGPGIRVLDVGAGSGNAAEAALAAGAAQVVASDPEPRMLALGRERLGDAVTWLETGAEELPLADGAFDVVVSCFGAIFAPDHEHTAAELARVGGVVALLDGFHAAIVVSLIVAVLGVAVMVLQRSAQAVPSPEPA